AVAVLGTDAEKNPRVELIRAAAEITRGYESRRSPDDRIVVRFKPGVDEILVPLLFDAVGRTIRKVGDYLGYHPQPPVIVEVLPGAEALSRMTGLGTSAIETSGTIAICKYGRLMVTSPRVTLKGYGWLDTASHELVHMIIAQKTLNRTPIWLHEALARYLDTLWRSDEPLYRKGLSPRSENLLARAVEKSELITFDQMHPSMALLPSQEAAELAFAEVYMAADFTERRFGRKAAAKILDGIRNGLDDSAALKAVTGMARDGFVRAWMSWMKRLKLRKLEGDPLLKDSRTRDERLSAERRLGSKRNLGIRDHLHLGELLRARGRTRAAVVEYTRAVDLAGPRHAAIWLVADKLGKALLELGKPGRAKKVFSKSLEVNPEDLEANLHVGLLLLEDDPYEGWLYLRRCERINPLDPRVQGALVSACKKLIERGDEHEPWKAHLERHERALEILRRQRARTVGGPSEKPPAEGTRPPLGTASLRINTMPWASVWLDGRDTGLTTPVFELSVSPGRHVLRLQADCTPGPVEIELNLRAGERKLIERRLCDQAE
ncbi:MAG: hypothetical protein D6806_17535, partial [Deltaproteobacteria bacterium]